MLFRTALLSTTLKKILLSLSVFLLSLGAYYLPFRAKGYAPDPGFSNLSIARNLSVSGTFDSEDGQGVLLPSDRAKIDGRPTAVQNPLTPAIYASLFDIFGTGPSALSTPLYVSIFLAAVFNVLMFLIVARLFGTMVGFTAASALALMPVRVMGALFYGGYEFAMLFFAIALWIFLTSKDGPFRPGLARLGLASVFFGLAALARNAFMVSFIPFVFYDHYSNRSFKRSLVLLLPFLIVFGSTLTQFSWLGTSNGYVSGIEGESFDVLGEVFPDHYTSSHRRLGYVTMLEAKGLDRSGAHFLGQWGYEVGLKERLLAYLDSAAYYLKTAIDPTTFGGPMILMFVLLGGYWLYRNKKDFFVFFGAWLLVWIGAVTYFQTANWDHYLEIIPIVAILFGLGVSEVADSLKIIGLGRASIVGTILTLSLLNLAYADKWRLSTAYGSSTAGRMPGIEAEVLGKDVDGIIAVGIHPSFAYRLNYLTDKRVLYFSPSTIESLVDSGELKNAFDEYNVGLAVGFPEKISDSIIATTGVKAIPLETENR